MQTQINKNLKQIIWRENSIAVLSLGTVQIGMNYGIANSDGKPDYDNAKNIVNTAINSGINLFDTAQAYGDSEQILGKITKDIHLTSGLYISTKLSPTLDPCDSISIENSIKQSLANLNRPCLWGLLLHRPDWMNYWEGNLGATIQKLKDAGKIKYTGVSVYSVEDALKALNLPWVDYIQVPCNIWDQRMLHNGVFSIAQDLGKLCLVRSIYLQGLINMTPEAVRIKLPIAYQTSKQWQNICNNLKISPVKAAIKFAVSLKSPCIVGMETKSQIDENIALFSECSITNNDEQKYIYDNLSPLVNENIYNPAMWKV